MSSSIGRAPARAIALAEAKKLKAVVITASPACTPAAASASQSASVPEEQPTASAAPQKAATSRSSASTSGPRIKCCEARTRSTAAAICSRSGAYCRLRSSIGIASNFTEYEKELKEKKREAGGQAAAATTGESARCPGEKLWA